MASRHHRTLFAGLVYVAKLIHGVAVLRYRCNDLLSTCCVVGAALSPAGRGSEA